MMKSNHVRTAQRGLRAGPLRPAFLFSLSLLLTLVGLFLLFSVPSGGLSGGHVLAQSAQSSPEFDLNQVTPPMGAPVARNGAAIYLENCAPCHGQTGMGDGPTVPDLPDPPTAFADPDAMWELSPAMLFHTTKYGRLEKLMPPWQNQLSDEEIWQAVAYAWSLHTDAAFVAPGADRYALSCESCHGPVGAGDGPDAEVDMVDLGDPVYAMTQSQADWMAGWEAAHPDIGADWDSDTQRQVLEYVRTFSYVPPWESSYRPGDGVIRGIVEQGTAGVTLPLTSSVSLDVFDQFMPVASFTTSLDADGGFTFTDLAVDGNLVYLASVATEGISYSSPLIRLSADAPETDTTITVYGTTTEAQDIVIERSHWIIDSQPGALLVGQILAFGSGGDRTFIGSPIEGSGITATVGIYIPSDAQEVSFENGVIGGRFAQVGDWVYDTTPLVPGEATKQIVVRYALPYEGNAYRYTQQFAYPMRDINLLIAELPQLRTDVTVLESMGAQEFQGRSYQIYQGVDLAATEIEVSLTGLLPPGSADPRDEIDSTGAANVTSSMGTATFAPWMAWTSGSIVVAFLLGAFAWVWRSGRTEPDGRKDEQPTERDELLRRIAQLDDLMAQGKLDEESWQAERALLKAKLVEMARHNPTAST